jgi:hypothetical protein
MIFQTSWKLCSSGERKRVIGSVPILINYDVQVKCKVLARIPLFSSALAPVQELLVGSLPSRLKKGRLSRIVRKCIVLGMPLALLLNQLAPLATFEVTMCSIGRSCCYR